jgi:hypothetical protein
MKKLMLLLSLFLPISLGGYFHVGHAAAHPMQPNTHRITESEAKDIAVKKVKGEVVGVILENDDGKAVYEVIVKSAGTVYEVEIDANTGKVLEVEKEGGHGGDDRRGNGDDHDDGHEDDDHMDD